MWHDRRVGRASVIVFDSTTTWSCISTIQAHGRGMRHNIRSQYSIDDVDVRWQEAICHEACLVKLMTVRDPVLGVFAPGCQKCLRTHNGVSDHCMLIRIPP